MLACIMDGIQDIEGFQCLSILFRNLIVAFMFGKTSWCAKRENRQNITSGSILLMIAIILKTLREWGSDAEA